MWNDWVKEGVMPSDGKTITFVVGLNQSYREVKLFVCGCLWWCFLGVTEELKKRLNKK